jgi:DNA-binding NtrC family response regulator
VAEGAPVHNIATYQASLADLQLVGTSHAIRSIADDIDAAARSNAKILITGETGVGKDVVATLIHRRSARRLARFFTLNCAGVPDSLLESELFGHIRGAFTDAYRDKIGMLEVADGGTLFLDEIGEMSLRMQAVLLRFLETGELQRVGADRQQGRSNVRVIAATNRNLADQIAAGSFREDLYYRLNIIRIHVPPLRERREDVPDLLNHFIRLCTREHGLGCPRPSSEAIEALKAYDWPGNVRELRNVVERLLLRGHGSEILLNNLPPEFRHDQKLAAAVSPERPASQTSGSKAAELLEQITEGRHSFWAVVHPLFMNRDVSRDVVREVVAAGLQRTAGNYRMLVGLFNMPATDYKRFLAFLRKHGCLVAFHPFRTVSRVA